MGSTGANSVDEQVRFLKKSEIFRALSEKELKVILERGQIKTYTQGDVIFDTGDPADAVYVVKTGVVEICRRSGEGDKVQAVAYLGESEAIGETAIITGSARGSMARVPEKVELLKIDRPTFMSLLSHIRGLPLTLLGLFARRLERGFREERAASHHRHLSGNLEYFDLPTVIQALANSSRTGTLIVRDKAGRVFAALYFEAGKMIYAKLGRLKGKEAFYQLVQSPRQHAFSFRGGPPPREFESDPEMAVAPMGLLLESARQQDELEMLKTRYPDPRRVFQPQSEDLAWKEEESLALAEEAWARLKRGETIAQLVSQMPASEYRVYKLLYTMHASGLVA
jgi:CRP-like cAMP-binding protein